MKADKQPRRRGPYSRATAYRRLELYWPDDAMLAELRDEAQTRGVSIQAHIRDLLTARHLARHGDSLARLVWVPEGAPSEAAPPPTTEISELDEAAARTFKVSLMDMTDDE